MPCCGVSLLDAVDKTLSYARSSSVINRCGNDQESSEGRKVVESPYLVHAAAHVHVLAQQWACGLQRKTAYDYRSDVTAWVRSQISTPARTNMRLCPSLETSFPGLITTTTWRARYQAVVRPWVWSTTRSRSRTLKPRDASFIRRRRSGRLSTRTRTRFHHCQRASWTSIRLRCGQAYKMIPLCMAARNE